MALGADIGGVVSGLINSGNDLPSIDLDKLFSTISSAGANERNLINALPANLQPLYAQYKASQNAAGTTLQNATDTTGNNLLTQTKALYDPNGPAVQATLAALKQQDYSTLPGSITALKSNLAASGGLDRGGAARAITGAVLAPAAQYSQQAATVTGNALTAQQQATQQALNKIASMDDATAQQLFGMSVAQATQILQSGRQDLQTQLTQLINQSNTETNQTLGVEGIQANNEYQNALTTQQQQAALVNGLVNTGVDAATMYATGGASAAPGMAFPQGDSTVNPALPNPASGVPGMGNGSGLSLY